jgi:seryl-tRNA synthetase
MAKNGKLVVLIVLLCGVLTLTGCGRKKLQQAQADAAAAQAELDKTKAQLQKTTAERDNLAAELKKLNEKCNSMAADTNNLKKAIEDTKTQLNNVTASRESLQEKVTSLLSTVQKLQENVKDTEPALYKVVFTTALTEDNVPINDLKEVSINQKRFYVFIKWRLPIADHVYEIKIFDGSGKMASDSPVKFTAQTTISNTWYEYAINKYIDQPGKWKFEIYLDGKKMAEEFINVTSDQAPK